MSKKLFIIPNSETEKFFIGIEDGIDSIEIGEVDGIQFVCDNPSKDFWTIKHPRQSNIKDILPKKELISLSRNYIGHYKHAKRKCIQNIQECSKKLLEKYGPMTASQILEKLVEMNGGKRKDDISTHRLARILIGHFNFLPPFDSYATGGIYYLDGQEIPEPSQHSYSKSGWLYSDEAESFYEENAEEFK